MASNNASEVEYDFAAPEVLSKDNSDSYLVLGATPPNTSEENLDSCFNTACSGIILLGKVEPAELENALAKVPDPAIPIADFADNHGLRRDFVGSQFTPSSISQLEQIWAPIWSRLASVPFRENEQARAEFTILRLAYSRDVAIEASFDATSPHLVEYPLIGKSAGLQSRLEILANMGLLARRHFTRTRNCNQCGSSRLNVYEVCPECGSADLKEETLVHHYRCGYQGVESQFTQGQFLICPKCRRALQHMGVDYGKPAEVTVCNNCHATNSEPPLSFACVDCSTVTPAEEARTTDWYHYQLTNEGIRSLREGHLPRFDIAPVLAEEPHALSPQEFRLLALHEMKVAKRFERNFSVALFSVNDLDKVSREHGPVETEIAFRRVIAAILGELRQCDFVGRGTNISIVIGFPETSTANVEEVAKRIQRVVKANEKVHINLSVDIAEGEAIVELLSRS